MDPRKSRENKELTIDDVKKILRKGLENYLNNRGFKTGLFKKIHEEGRNRARELIKFIEDTKIDNKNDLILNFYNHPKYQASKELKSYLQEPLIDVLGAKEVVQQEIKKRKDYSDRTNSSDSEILKIIEKEVIESQIKLMKPVVENKKELEMDNPSGRKSSNKA